MGAASLAYILNNKMTPNSFFESTIVGADPESGLLVLGPRGT